MFETIIGFGLLAFSVLGYICVSYIDGITCKKMMGR